MTVSTRQQQQQMEMTTIGHPFPGPERVSAYRHPVRGFLWTPARISGVTSLVLQVVSLVVSFFLLGALFMHIGGGKLLKIGGGHNETTTNETETSAGGLLNGGRIYPTLTPGALYQEFENAAQKNISLFGPMETNLDVGRGMDDNSSWMNNNFTANESKMLDPFRDDKQVHFTEKELDMLKASGTSQPISETLSNIVEGGKSTAANQKTTTDDALEFFTARTETLVPNVTEPSSVQLLQGPFEQVEPVRSKIGHVEFDLVGLLRNLCFVDTGLSVLWFLSIMCLLISLRHEVPDLIYINLLVLIIVTIFVIIFAGLVAVLLLYERKYRWGVIFTIGGFVGGTAICVLLNVIAVGYLIAWHRYVDYMNGGDECLCFSCLTSCIKRGQHDRRRKEVVTTGYSIPEATNHPNIPYIDDQSPNRQVQQFSNF